MSGPCSLGGVERNARRRGTEDRGVQGTVSGGTISHVRGHLLGEEGLLELRLGFPL